MILVVFGVSRSAVSLSIPGGLWRFGTGAVGSVPETIGGAELVSDPCIALDLGGPAFEIVTVHRRGWSRGGSLQPDAIKLPHQSRIIQCRRLGEEKKRMLGSPVRRGGRFF